MQIELDKYKDVLEGKFILIASSNSKEKEAVNEMLTFRRNLLVDIEHKGCYIGLIKDVFVIHLSGLSGIADKHAISRIIMNFISKGNLPKPKCVLLIGFCWGVPDKTSIGSIIFCDTVFSINSDKVEDGNVIYKKIELKSNLKLELFQTDITDCLSNSLSGILASRERLFSDTEQRDLLIKEFPDIIGGEMEAFGFIPSIENNNWLIIKTVSDYGDSQFNRDNQIEAASHAANTLPSLVAIFKNHDLVSEYIEDDSYKMLLDVLIGNTLKIFREISSPETLNDYLNDKIGPLIEYKLQYFLTGAAYDELFVYDFCNLLLEMTQNSFKHGGATVVDISFSSNSITYSDNGDFYDISEISGNNGGADAWNNIKTNFIETGNVDYSIKKMKNFFDLKMIDTDLQKIIKKCSVSIKPGTVGSPYKSKNLLVYNSECTSVYVNDIENRMSSRRLSVINEVKRLLEKGLKVYVTVRSETEAEKYRSLLSDHEEYLKMIIKN